ncbi:SET domain-containing protein-lysine N-methyltransferase [bacterium]|nr:SET domain-containing protein-lysine N-methyltransferase [bacterium]
MSKSVIETKEEIEATFGIAYLEELSCCEKVLKKVKKRAQRKLMPLYSKKQNRWMLGLYGEKIRKRASAKVYLELVNPLIGYGVFAGESLPSLSYIGEYTGTLRKRRRFKDKGNDYIFGYMVGAFGTPWIIDAKEKGNFTRFINHSFYPNISSRGVVVDGVYRVIFFANKAIKKGEQLTYDYGPTYWNGSRPYPQDL